MRNIAADLKPGDFPPWVEDLVQSRKENLHKEHMSLQCLPWGPSYASSIRMTKIVQTPELMVMLDSDLIVSSDFHGRPQIGDRPQSQLDGVFGGALGRETRW